MTRRSCLSSIRNSAVLALNPCSASIRPCNHTQCLRAVDGLTAGQSAVITATDVRERTLDNDLR
jgi:hypothetical protein